MLPKNTDTLDVVSVDFGIGKERYTMPAVTRIETQAPRSGQTASGYVSRIPTRHMLHINGRWQRVYAMCYSNVATCYIFKNGKKIIVDW